MDYIDEALKLAEKMGLNGINTGANDKRRKGHLLTDRKTQSISDLREQHKEILRLLVLGWKPKAIAARLDITAQTVSNVRNSPVAQAQISSLSALRDDEMMAPGESIRQTAMKAADNLRQVVEKGSIPVMIDGEIVNQVVDAKTIISTSRDVLDRAGHGKIQKVAGQIEHSHYTPDEINTIRQEALQLAEARRRENSDAIDVEYGVVNVD